MDIQKLLDEVKVFLNYTWKDSTRDLKLTDYIQSSIQYLQEVADSEIDFSKDYLAKDLLFNRVLYMNSQALDDFISNYHGMLGELKIKYGNVEEEN